MENLQVVIAVVIVLGFITTAAVVAYYQYYNKHQLPPSQPTEFLAPPPQEPPPQEPPPQWQPQQPTQPDVPAPFRVTARREGGGQQPNRIQLEPTAPTSIPPQPSPQREQPPTPRTFTVIAIRPPAIPVAPAAPVAPDEWGPSINRPANVPVYHKQQKCVACHQSLGQSFANKGWARCRRTKKLIHSYCYEDYGKCPFCHSCTMSIEGRAN